VPFPSPLAAMRCTSTWISCGRSVMFASRLCRTSSMAVLQQESLRRSPSPLKLLKRRC
ncbi:hypothetical protein M9458_028178, partial [Cirrhinus mrigala]